MAAPLSPSPLPRHTVDTVCGYCGVGCGLRLEVADGVVVQATGNPDHPVNRGRLCTKGATTADLLAAGGRLTTASLRHRRDAEPEPTATAAAITEAGARLRHIRDTHGPDAIGIYVSGQMSLEAQYLATKLAKGFLRTRWLESNSRLCMAAASTGYKQSLGTDGPPGSYDDIDAADVFLVIGANMADCHPVLFLRLLDRVRAGARLIVVDPRRTATAAKADLHLPIRPGTDLALLNGLLRLLHDNGAVDEDFIGRSTDGWYTLAPLLADHQADRVAEITGLPEADIRRAADLLGGTKRWMSLWTMGLNQSVHGVWHTNALINLHLATGAICRPGAGPFSLTGQPNAMGGREMGYLGPGLPGQRSVTDPADRAFTEDRWGLEPNTIRDDFGSGTVDMFRAMADGDIRAAWIMCTNPVATVAKRQTVVDALSAADVVILQEAFEGAETAAYADVVLPAALWTEADGVLVNSERTLTRCVPAVPPPGEALPDWRLICLLAAELGYREAFDYPDAAAVFDEIAGFANPATGWDLRGVNHDRLAAGPVQWPAAPGGADRNPVRYLDADGRPRFPTPDGRAHFLARPHLPPAELPDDDFPMLLTTGRSAHQWHTRTKTGRVAALNRLDPGPRLQLHPDDAERLGIADGAPVAVTSRRGRAVLPARLDPGIRPGVCFAPMHWNDSHAPEAAINAVTNDAVDPESRQPEYKVCAVALRQVGPPPPRSPGRAPSAAAIRVVWASTTGTAETFAVEAAERLVTAGLDAEACDAARLGLDDLTGTVLFAVATSGSGDAPDNGAALWDALRPALPGSLHGLRYAVLGFGDSGYPDFCGFARRLDARLTDLGARALVPRALCEPDHRPVSEPWLSKVCEALGSVAPTPAAVAPAGPPGSGRDHPLRTTVLGNRLLSGPGSAKQVRAVSVALPGGGPGYRAGDALGVRPVNRPETIAEWLRLTGLPTSDTAAVAERDLTGITPALLRFCHDRRPSERLAELLADPAGLAARCHGRQALDLLAEHPVTASVAEWLAVLPPLRPRLYSISSSPQEDPERVSITVSVVRFDSDHGTRAGVCSGYLAELAAGDEIEVFVVPTRRFRPPTDPAAPMIMIGPGTGVAPFRGFLHERAATGGGENWLFFGEQHEASDFYYRDELAALKRDGVLSRLELAFSRDGETKVYVQHRMREQAAALWQLLQRGGCVYVCGDAARMARDVDGALREIVARQGRLAPAAADAYVDALAAEGRYVRDVY